MTQINTILKQIAIFSAGGAISLLEGPNIMSLCCHARNTSFEHIPTASTIFCILICLVLYTTKSSTVSSAGICKHMYQNNADLDETDQGCSQSLYLVETHQNKMEN